MKKQPLDPNAKRDFSVLCEYDKDCIKEWIKKGLKLKSCPLGMGDSSCDKCDSLFPELKNHPNKDNECPCSILYVNDVIAVAKEAIIPTLKEMEVKENERV